MKVVYLTKEQIKAKEILTKKTSKKIPHARKLEKTFSRPNLLKAQAKLYSELNAIRKNQRKVEKQIKSIKNRI